jgi:hypothetical protein
MIQILLHGLKVSLASIWHPFLRNSYLESIFTAMMPDTSTDLADGPNRVSPLLRSRLRRHQPLPLAVHRRTSAILRSPPRRSSRPAQQRRYRICVERGSFVLDRDEIVLMRLTGRCRLPH